MQRGYTAGVKRSYDWYIVEDCTELCAFVVDSANVLWRTVGDCTSEGSESVMGHPEQIDTDLNIRTAVDYMAVAQAIEEARRIHPDTVRTVRPEDTPILFESHRSSTGAAAAESHWCCRRTSHRRRCRNSIVSEGQGRGSAWAAALHTAPVVHGRIYENHSGGKT
jgi:hypothetical protein